MGDNIPSFPDESVITNDSASSSFPTNTTTTTNTNTTTTQIPPITNSTKPKSNKGKIIATLFGILLLIGGIGAGIVLVGQQQIFKQQAATPDANSCVVGSRPAGAAPFCDRSGPNTNDCTDKAEGSSCKTINFCGANTGSCQVTVKGGANTECQCVTGSSGAFPSCTSSGVDINASCTQSSSTTGASECLFGSTPYYCCAPGFIVQNGKCVSSGSSGGGSTGGGSTGGGSTSACNGDCITSYNGVNLSPTSGNCGQIGRPEGAGNCSNGGRCCLAPGAGGGNSNAGPTVRTCGEACSSDVECQRNKSNSSCQHGVCVNTACPTTTQAGANCACTNTVNCGQQPLFGQHCATGSEHGLINITNKNSCDSYTVQSGTNVSAHEYCIPTAPTHGYKRIVSCTDLQVHNLAKPDGSITGLTQQDVLTACSAEATTAPNTASCSNITAYDSTWNVLTSTQLAALTSGTVVNFSIKGTTTSSFDKARFTINGTDQGETTNVKPGATQEFYVQYTIPANTTNFTVTGQIHDSGTSAWY